MPTLDDIFADLPDAVQAKDKPRSIDDIFADEPKGELHHGETRRNAAGVLEIGVGGTAGDAPRAPAQAAAGGFQGLQLPNWQDVKHQGAMALRAPVQAGAELMGMIGDPLASTYNMATGRNVEMPSKGYERGLDETFGKPQTPAEHFANRVAAGGFGAAATMGGAALAKPAGAVGQGIRDMLTTNPLGQVAGAGTGAGAGEMAKQAGYPWWAQFAANLIGAPLGGKAASSTADWVGETGNLREAARSAGGNLPNALEQRARDIAQQSGANWDDLTQQVRNGLMQSVEQSIRTGAPVDPVRAQRSLAFQQLGAQPTNAMLTRNPQDWAREDRLRGIPGVGEPLDQVHENVGNAVRDMLTARGQPGDTATGRAIAGGLGEVRQDLAGARTKAYTAARESPEGMQGVPTSDLQAFLNSRQTRAGTQPQFKDALAELDRLSAGSPSLTQNNFEELRKTVNAMRNPMDAPSMNATGEIRQAMDDAFQASGKAPAFDEARFAQGLYKSTTSDQAIVDKLTSMASRTDRKVPYADVFDTLIKADPAAIKQVKNTLIVGGKEQAWDTMKARTMEELASTLNQGATTENRGATFLRKMDNLAEQLPVIFEPEELARLQAARSIVENAMTAPRGTLKLSNPSGTANAMIGHAYDILKASGVAGGRTLDRALLGFPKELLGRPIVNYMERSRVNDAMNPSLLTGGLLAGQPTSTPWLTPALLGLVYGGGARGPGEDR